MTTNEKAVIDAAKELAHCITELDRQDCIKKITAAVTALEGLEATNKLLNEVPHLPYAD